MSSPDGERRGSPAVLTSLWAEDDRAWNSAVDVLDRRRQGWLWFVLHFAWVARRYPCVLLLGSMGRRDLYQDLVIALLVRRVTHRRARIVLTDCTWSQGSKALSGDRRVVARVLRVAHRLLVRGLDGPRTVFCVLSEDERRVFPATWGVAPQRVVATPFSHTVWDHDGVVPPRGDYVFAGGDSMRDYDLLLRACRGLDLRVVVGTRLPLPDAPPNVEVGPLSHEEFMDSLLGAGAVVVPLRDDGYRSAGQQTYLNAMLLEKPVVVTDALGVRDIIVDGVDGMVVPAEPSALRAALVRCLSPGDEDEVARMGREARQKVLRDFTPAAYRGRILEVAYAGLHGRGSDASPA